jgi:hypothetical protein
VTENLPSTPQGEHLPPLAVTPNDQNVTPPRTGNIFMMPTKPKADM